MVELVGPAEVTHLHKISGLERQTDLSARTDIKRVSGGVANQAAPTFPIIIAEWPRNYREIIRVALDRFNNHYTIDIRSWWRDHGGIFRPCRNGLTLGVKHLPALTDGLADALDRARAFGLVEPIITTTNKDKTAAARQRRYRERHRNGGAET
jgi:hypothetical protein